MKKVTIVVPCYNEEESIELFYDTIKKTVTKMKKKCVFEIIFVNDGSKDKTLQIIRDLAKKDKMIRYISFSRNFGKEAAMYAGFEASTGDYVTTMDVDLQDPPELLEEMFDIVNSGEYDCCATKSTNRKGYSLIRKLFTKMFYSLIGKLSKTEMVPGARDYRLMNRKMVNAIISMKEYNRYSKGLFGFVGFDTKWIEFDIVERQKGKSKYSMYKLFSYAIEGIIDFSTKPLVISALFGLLFCLIAFVMIIVVIAKTLIWGDPVGGIQLFCIGIMGQYLAKTYSETKNRPIYIVKETEEDLK